MGAETRTKVNLCGIVLLTSSALGMASPIDINLKTTPLKATESTADDTSLDSGLRLGLQNSLMEVALDYKVRSRFNVEGDPIAHGTSQRLGTNLKSSLIDNILGGKTQLRSESVFISGVEQYRHQLNPTYSRSLLDMATLDLGYRYGLERSSPVAPRDESSAYEFALKGTLPWLPLDWSGAYTSASKLQGSNNQLINTESYNLQSDYSVSPQLKVKLFSKLKEETRLAGEQEKRSSELRYGAGFSWQPTGQYALDLKIDKQTVTATGEDTLLHSGVVSWFPEKGIEFSLEYSDQLVEGTPGWMFNTELDLDRIWN